MTRLGLQIPNFSFGVSDAELFGKVADLARAAEDAGFDSVWVMDHFYQLPMLGGREQPMLEGYTTLGAVAALTTRVRLGTLVTGVTYRNPALLAKAVTTLDVISRGRAICGIGAAWHDVEHEAFGFDFPPVSERMDRLEEAVRICRLMFTEEEASFEGRYYRVASLRNIPRPVTPGGPPIMIGGGGERRTLKLVAQHADMCNIFGSPEDVRHKVNVLRKHCAEAGRDPSSITVSRLATLVLTDSPEHTEQVRTMVAAAGRPVNALNIGQEHELVAQVEGLIESGVDYFIFNMPLSGPDAVRRVGALLSPLLAD